MFKIFKCCFIIDEPFLKITKPQISSEVNEGSIITAIKKVGTQNVKTIIKLEEILNLISLIKPNLTQGDVVNKNDYINLYLNLLDDFEDAIKLTNDKQISEGLSIIYSKAIEYLKLNFDIVPIDAVGKLFNNEYHKSIKIEYVDKKNQDGIVVAELKTGFLKQGKTFRFSEVVVGKINESKNKFQ